MTSLKTVFKHNFISPPRRTLVTRKLFSPFKFKKNVCMKRYNYQLVACSNRKPPENGEEHSSEKDQSIHNLFKMTEDENQTFRLIPLAIIMHSLANKQSAAMVSCLIAYIANNMELIAKINTDGVPGVGFSWDFEWGSDTPLGRFFSIYMSHEYSGKIMLRKSKAIIEPLMRLEKLRKKLKATVMPVMEAILIHSNIQGKRRALLNSFLALLFMIISLVFWKNAVT